MADAPPDPPSNNSNDPKATVKWIPAEIIAMLDELAVLKATHMSGNGFKPQAWAKVVPKVINANPDTTQQKDKTQCMNKLAYLKKVFVLYVFVRKYSGTGWDDEEKHATNTKEYIEELTKTRGKDYMCCFTTPCPYWMQLDTFFEGMNSRATGENIIHLPTKKTRICKNKNKNAATAPSASTSTSHTPLQPLASSSNTNGPADSFLGDDDHTLVDPDIGAAPAAVLGLGGAATGPFDDELGSVSPSPKSKKRQRANTDDENNNGANNECRKPKRQRSESGGTARRNAEAGTQISCALDNFATVMAQPLVTSEDLSPIKEIIEILRDKTLLPEDPRRKLYRAVSKVLSHNAAQARLFILEDDRTRHMGILEGILEDAGLLPDTWASPLSVHYLIHVNCWSSGKKRVAFDIVFLVYIEVVDGRVDAEEVVEHGGSCDT
ncbi:hypothetical protein B0H17DRAFT_1193855 [Mycena rosella]|uniref:Myb/SANT-like domain-containing protein n=1 Tax=Mycena rosella TaxID=1033263 RepID=A0AAD7GRV0_MYCRO|nr:hypothetical protein B0H17DRAFT_1193855 [Mycena rosella]